MDNRRNVKSQSLNGWTSSKGTLEEKHEEKEIGF